MLDLPTELLVTTASNSFTGVFNHLDIRVVRAVCKRWLTASTQLYRQTHFTTVTISLDSNGLSKLTKIAAHHALASCAQTIQFSFGQWLDELAYEKTLRQLPPNFTIGSLASSLDELPNLKVFRYALQRTDELVISQWCSLLRIKPQSGAHEPADVLKDWFWMTIEAAVFSTTKLERIEMDDGPAAIMMSHRTTDSRRFRTLSKDSTLSLDSLQLRIDPEKYRPHDEYTWITFNGKAFYRKLFTNLTKVNVYVAATTSHAGRTASNDLMWQCSKVPRLQEIEVYGDTDQGRCLLKNLIECSPGTLRKVKLRTVSFETERLVEAIGLLKQLTTLNHLLEDIDLGRHTFEHEMASGDVVRLETSIEDSDRMFGFTLLQDKLDTLQKWVDLAGIA